MAKTATNPETGERLELVGGKWKPLKTEDVKTATNPETGERVKLVNGSWEPFEENKPSLGERVGAGLGGALKGATLNASDHIEAGLASVVPIDRMVAPDGSADVRFGSYRRNLEEVRKRNAKQKAAAPKTYFSGEVGGAVLGLGKAAKAGATTAKVIPKSTTGVKKLAATTTALSIDGAVISGASSALAGKSKDEVIEDVKTGAKFGAVGNLGVKFTGAVGGRLMKMFKPAKSKAVDEVLKTAAQSGKSPDDIKKAFTQASDDGASEFMLLDALGEAGVRKANGISRSGGEAAKVVRGALDARQAGQSGRIVDILDEGLGAGGKTATQKSKEIKKLLRETDNANFGNIPNQPVKAGQALKASAVKKADGVKMTKIEKRLDNYNKLIGTEKMDVNRLITIRQQVADDTSKAFRAGKGSLGTKLKALQKAIDDDILVVSDAYRKANAASSAIRRTGDALEAGKVSATKGRPQDIIDDVSKMSKPETDAFRAGLSDKLSETAERSRVGTNSAEPLRSDKFKEVFAKIAPNSEALSRQIEREGQMFANRARITGGSQTVDNLADSVINGTIPALLRGDFRTALGVSLVKARNQLSGLDADTRTEVARMLISRSDDKFVAEAARRLQQNQKLSVNQVKLVYASVAMASITE